MVYQNNAEAKICRFERSREAFFIISVWFPAAPELTEASIVAVHSHLL